MGSCCSKLRLRFNRHVSPSLLSPQSTIVHSPTHSLSSSIDVFSSQTTLPISTPFSPLPLLDVSAERFTWDGEGAFDGWMSAAIAALPAALPVATPVVVRPVRDEDDDTFFVMEDI